MRLPQIINSLLEVDLYKFSMGQCIYHQFSGYKTTWTFKCRNKDVFFTPEMVEEITEQIKAYCGLRFAEDELEYLENIKWIKGSYVDFLRIWQPRFEDFTITTEAECGLAIEAGGSWLNTSMYEIPILAIVNEVYFRMKYDYETLRRSPLGTPNAVSDPDAVADPDAVSDPDSVSDPGAVSDPDAVKEKSSTPKDRRALALAETMEQQRRLIQAIDERKIPFRILKAGDRIVFAEDCTISVLHPTEKFVREKPKLTNANSLVLLIEYQGVRFLLTGDLAPPGLDVFLTQTPIPCDVVFAPHHGAKNCATPEFGEWCMPKHFIICDSYENQQKRTKENFEKMGACVYHTGRDGAVFFSVKDGKLDVEDREKWKERDKWN